MLRTLPFFVLVLSVALLSVTVHLARQHLAVFEGGIAEGLFCGGTGRFDCSQVAAHESSRLLGVPLAFWGLGYAILNLGIALAALVLRGADRKPFLAAGALICTLAFVFDLYLGYVMVAQIGTICLNCVATYVLNLLLALSYVALDRGLGVPLAWGRLVPSLSALRGGSDADHYAAVIKGALLGLTLVAGTLTLASFQWAERQIETYGEREAKRFLERTEGPAEIDMTRFAGQPSRGPADAPLQVALIGDFQCSFCRALAHQLEAIRAERPGQLRLIFVNAPISSACNPAIDFVGHADACWLAEVGECALSQGKFWTYHDRLYESIPHARVDRRTVSAKLPSMGLDTLRISVCLSAGEGAAAVTSDLQLCRDLRLSATPSVVINGYVKRGSFFPWMLRRVIAAMLDPHEPRERTGSRS